MIDSPTNVNEQKVVDRKIEEGMLTKKASPIPNGNHREDDKVLSCVSREGTVIPSSSPPPSPSTTITENEFLWTQHLSLPIFVVDTSTQHHILVWNPSTEKLTGTPATAVIGRPLESIIVCHGQKGYRENQSTPVKKKTNTSTSSSMDGNTTTSSEKYCMVHDESSSSTQYGPIDDDDESNGWDQLKESIHYVLSPPAKCVTSLSRRCEVCLSLPTTIPATEHSSEPPNGHNNHQRRYQVTMSTQRNQDRDDVVSGVVCFLELLGEELPPIGGGDNNDQNGRMHLPTASPITDTAPSNDTDNTEWEQNFKSHGKLGRISIPPTIENNGHDNQHRRNQQQQKLHSGIDLEDSAQPILGVDGNKRIYLWNDMAVKLFGYTQEQIIGRQLKDLPITWLNDDASATSTMNDGDHGKENSMTETSDSKRGRDDFLDDALSNKNCMISGRKFAIQNPLDGSVQTGMVNFLPDWDPSSGNYGNSVDGLILLCTILDNIPASNGVKSTLLESRTSRQRQQRQLPGHPFNEYQHLFETANTPIFGVDRFGIVNEWNVRMAELTGISKQDAVGAPLIENGAISISYMKDVVGSVLDKAYRGRGSSNVELEITTQRYGETRFLLVNVTPRRNSRNEIVGAVAIAEDVTEACNHDRAVAALANELRQLIDTANAPIFGIDRDGDVNEWNDKTAEITGYAKEEAFDCSLVDMFIVPDIQDSVQDVLDNALDGRGTSNYELEFRTKSDEIRHLLVNATPQRDMDNNIVGVVAIAQDVTEAVQRDRAVAGMALELRQLIDTANAPIFGIDIDGNVNEWNRRTSEITKFTKEEAFDEPLVETFIAPSMREKVQEILDSALSGNETSNYELEFVSKTGEPIFLLVNATTRRDPENNVVGVVGVAQDVTEDKKHSQVLREMQTLRATQEAKVEIERNMTAYFAHELRNPLGAIDSALNAMPDNLPESAQTLISGMQLCTGFMSSIMNNLLDVRKMEEGKMQLSKAPVSLRKLLNNVHKMLQPSIRPGVEFRKVADVKGKDWVLGDSHRIQQVMTNVVTNAIKYTVNGYIQLSIGWEGDDVIFVCEDTGPGIPKSEQEKLFQRFVQRGGAPGTGLGLAIAKHLVDLTGGSIRFESDPSVKAGTTCIVQMRLPVCEAPDTVVEESSALIQEPISFLIIDDIKMNRMMLKRRIMKGIAPNAEITEAATGEEALEICGRAKFDVIVVDQYMEEAGGVMVGTDVVFAMRRMRIDSVIVGCSGNDMGAQFFDAGADWVWQKPMPSNTKIIHDLRTSLSKRNARRLM